MADVRTSPHRDYPFFIYDPEGDGLLFFRTEAERDAHVPRVIDAYLDDGWSEMVEQVACGTLTHIATQVGRENRPADPEEAEEEGWPPDCEYRCNYEALPISPPTQGASRE